MARLVSFRDAALGYGHAPALTGLTLDVFGGQALALVGPNGGGKTTLMRGIVGGCSVLSGSVEVAEVDGLPVGVCHEGFKFEAVQNHAWSF